MKQYREIQTFPSKSSSKTYTVKMDEQGNLSCDCRSWIYNKYERKCFHTQTVALQIASSTHISDKPMLVSSTHETKRRIRF